MAKYKLVEMADMDKTGTRKVYPKMVTYRTLSTEEFIKKMKWMFSVGGNQIFCQR